MSSKALIVSFVVAATWLLPAPTLAHEQSGYYSGGWDKAPPAHDAPAQAVARAGPVLGALEGRLALRETVRALAPFLQSRSETDDEEISRFSAISDRPFGYAVSEVMLAREWDDHEGSSIVSYRIDDRYEDVRSAISSRTGVAECRNDRWFGFPLSGCTMRLGAGIELFIANDPNRSTVIRLRHLNSGDTVPRQMRQIRESLQSED